MIVFFEICIQMVRNNVCRFSTEVGKSYTKNMDFMYMQYKYNISEICKTAIRENY
jgi:hypothetical protein